MFFSFCGYFVSSSRSRAEQSLFHNRGLTWAYWYFRISFHPFSPKCFSRFRGPKQFSQPGLFCFIIEASVVAFLRGSHAKLGLKSFTKEEYSESKRLAQERALPFIDCLNAVQARDHGAILVSQDDHCLRGLSDISKAVRPEQVS